MNPNAAIAKAIERIRRLPAHLERLVADCAPAQLTTHFLENEWTVAQNVHHLADSHMNAFIRVKLMLTEEHPVFKPYNQDAWAETPDANNPDLSTSFAILRGMHARWAALLRSLPDSAWARTGMHPETQRVYTVNDILRTYGNHGEAHLDQIRRTLEAQRA